MICDLLVSIISSLIASVIFELLRTLVAHIER